MSSNLVTSITQALTSHIVERLSSSLGLERAQIESAMRAGVPALLAALSSLVSKPGGAAALQGAVSRLPADLLTKVTNAVGGAGQSTLIESANSGLASLLGPATTSAVANAVARYAGIGTGESQSIMGMLGSAVMSVLGQQQRARKLDASGLAGLLTSQADNIARAMPAGFGKYLSGTGILDGIAQMEDDSPAHTSSGSPGYTVPFEPKSAPTPWGWVLPVVALALAIGLWQLFSRSDEQHADVTPSAPATTADSSRTAASPDAHDTPSSSGASTGEAGLGPVQGPNFQALERLRGIKVGSVDFGMLSTSAVNGLRDSLATIADEASARAALEPLRTSADELRGISSLASQLSPEDRSSVASVIAAVRPTLDQLCDQALRVPGAGPIIKPTIDDIRAKLDTLATTRAS